MRRLLPGRLFSLLLLLLPAFFPVRAAWCQANDFQELMSGKTLPLTLKPHDLTGDWRQVKVGDEGGSDLFWQLQFMGGGNLPPTTLYYTKGQMLSIGGISYLVAYRATLPVDPDVLRRGQFPGTDANSNPLPAPKLNADTVLSLCLLNLKMSGSFNDIRAFDPATDIQSDADRVREENDRSDNNLRQIGLALTQYTQDYDELLPPMIGAKSEAVVRNLQRSGINSGLHVATVQEVLLPYSRSTDIFLHPTTHQPYIANRSVSRRNLSSFESPQTVVTFYEDRPAPDKTRGVLFLDGHVERIAEDEWQRLRKKSKFPP